MAEYDELFDKWVAAGLSRDDIEDKTSDWLAEKNVSMSDPLIPEFNSSASKKQRVTLIP